MKIQPGMFHALAAVAALMLAACGGQPQQQNTSDAGAASVGAKTLIYCSEGSPAGFDPGQHTAGTDFDASSYTVYNGLVEFERGGTEIRPALAEKWEVSADGKTYTFHLRRGVKFGKTDFFTPSRDFSADDVLFTLRRMSDPEFAYNKAYPAEFPYASDMGFPKMMAALEKVDDYTVKIVLKEPNAPFLQNLAMPFAYILSAEYADQLLQNGAPGDLDLKPVGTGPFVFKSYQKDIQIRYVKNADYWAPEEVHLDNLVFSITKDSAARAQKMQAGECHVAAYPQPAEVVAAKKAGKVQVLEAPGYNVGYVAYNVERGKLGDVRVRRALDMAIDKDAILNAVYQGAGVKATNPMPPSQWGYHDQIQDAPHDPEQARALLQEAGVPEGFEISLWYMPVQRPYNPNAKLMAEMIQADWAKVGVKAKLVTYEWGEYLKRISKGEADADMGGWTGDNGDPDNWLGTLLTCASVNGNNHARWCNPQFDQLVNAARAETDKDKRIAAYRQAQVIFKDQLPWTTMAHSVVTHFVAPQVRDYQISPLGSVRFDGVKVEQ